MLTSRFSTIRSFGAFLVGAVFTAAMVGPAVPAAAALLDIRLDFGDGYKSETSPANWNEVKTTFLAAVTVPGAEQALVDFNAPATPTGVALKVTQRFYASTFSSASAWANPHAPWMDANAQSALADWALAFDGAGYGQLVFTGMDPDSRYTVELLGVRAGIDTNARYQVNGAAGTVLFASTPGTGTTATWNADDDGYTAQGFMQWLNVAPSVSGEIIIGVDRVGGNGTYAFLNAMRIAEIPEPNAAAILLIGLLVLSVRRRVKRI